MKTICPYCNYKADGHETLKDEKNPEEKDISFCINCGELSEYVNKGLIKVDVEKLEKDVKEEINDIRVAWLKRRAIDSVK